MKDYEEYTLFALSMAIIYSIGNPVITMIFNILFLVILARIKKYFGILLIFVLAISSYFNVFHEEISIGEKYKAKIFVDKNYEIKKIKGKNLKNKIYIKDIVIENTGYYDTLVEVKKIDKFNQMFFLEGNVLEVEETYFNKYRSKIRKIIERNNYSFQVESFVKAIVLGEKLNLGKELEEEYRKVGASHILTISGLHIGIVISAFLGIFHFFGFSYKLKYSLSLLVLTLYVLILGNNPAVVRAYIMGAIFMLSKLFFEKASVKKSYCISIIVVVLINPLIIKDLSFMMSYGALFGIIYIFDKVKTSNIYYDAFLLSLIVQIALTPITIYYFKSIYLYTFIFNVFIVIWGDFLINLIFLGVFLESIKLGFITKEMVEFLYKVLDIFIKTSGKFPYSSIEVDKEIGLYFFIFMLITLASLYINKIYFGYLLAVAILIYNFLPYETKIEKDYIYFPKNKVLVLLNERKEEDTFANKAKQIISYKERVQYKDKLILLKRGEELIIENFIFKNLKNKEIEYTVY